jgi:hypothetical protein
MKQEVTDSQGKEISFLERGVGGVERIERSVWSALHTTYTHARSSQVILEPFNELADQHLPRGGGNGGEGGDGGGPGGIRKRRLELHCNKPLIPLIRSHWNHLMIPSIQI